mmetsp:Transcript_39134/g.72275  ORF Transcript_39134/g.72275 Transcript_39134/m.72275 type:complete len:348 (+) Transcript_39134:61-1104(+)
MRVSPRIRATHGSQAGKVLVSRLGNQEKCLAWHKSTDEIAGGWEETGGGFSKTRWSATSHIDDSASIGNVTVSPRRTAHSSGVCLRANRAVRELQLKVRNLRRVARVPGMETKKVAQAVAEETVVTMDAETEHQRRPLVGVNVRNSRSVELVGVLAVAFAASSAGNTAERIEHHVTVVVEVVLLEARVGAEVRGGNVKREARLGLAVVRRVRVAIQQVEEHQPGSLNSRRKRRDVERREHVPCAPGGFGLRLRLATARMVTVVQNVVDDDIGRLGGVTRSRPDDALRQVAVVVDRNLANVCRRSESNTAQQGNRKHGSAHGDDSAWGWQGRQRPGRKQKSGRKGEEK